MRTRAAVLYEMEKPRPYAASSPLVIDDLERDAPQHGERGQYGASSDVPNVLPGVVDLAPDDHVVFSDVPICASTT